MSDTERLMTTAEVAAHCRVAERTVVRWIKSGDLASIKVGRRRLIAVPELHAYLSRLRA